MAEYFDRDAALSEIARREALMVGDKRVSVDAMKSFIKNRPAVDVAPIVHGRWGTGRFNLETGNYEEQCTRCRNFSKEYDKPYCPNCGAKMDGGDDNAESVD